jgi:hypothetical protein
MARPSSPIRAASLISGCFTPISPPAGPTGCSTMRSICSSSTGSTCAGAACGAQAPPRGAAGRYLRAHPIRRAPGGRRRRDLRARLRYGPRRDRQQAAGRAVSLRPGGQLDQGQVRQAQCVSDHRLRREARRQAAQDRLVRCGSPRRGPAALCRQGAQRLHGSGGAQSIHPQRRPTLRAGQQAESDLGGAGDRGRGRLQHSDREPPAARSRVQGLARGPRVAAGAHAWPEATTGREPPANDWCTTREHPAAPAGCRAAIERGTGAYWAKVCKRALPHLGCRPLKLCVT